MSNTRSKPSKMKKYGSYNEWKNDQSSCNQEIVGALDELIIGIAPHLNRTVKWGQGCYVSNNEPRIYLHAEPDYVQLGFYNGAALHDPNGKGAYVRHVKVFSSESIDRDKYLQLIKQVI